MGAISREVVRDWAASGSCEDPEKDCEVRRRLRVREDEAVPEKDKDGWRGRQDLSDMYEQH